MLFLSGYSISFHIATKGLLDLYGSCSFDVDFADSNVCFGRAMKPKSDIWISGGICHLVHSCPGQDFPTLSALSQFRNHKSSCEVPCDW